MAYRIWKPRLLVIPLITAFVLTSCQPSEPSEDPPPSATAETTQAVTPSPTVSATPTPKPATAEGPAENIPVPDMPESARENSKNGAISFAEHYFDIINYSTATTTSDELKKLTSRECQLCGERFIDPLDTAVLNSAWQVGGEYSYRLIDLLEPTANRAIAIFNFSSAPQAIYMEPNDSVVEWDAVNDGIVSFEMEFDGSWEVVGLVTPKSD